MNSKQNSEALFQKVNRVFLVLYYLFCAGLVIRYAISRDSYHLGISIGTLAVPPVVALVYRLFHWKHIHQLDFLILAFITLSYPLGSCLDLYRVLPGFDKVAHTLSGVFVSVLCLIMYYALKPGHKIESADTSLAMVFTFLGSMAVAGLWEIGEYAISAIVKLDLQRVMTTGVSDSMLDMIVCMAGTLVTLPFVHRLCHGKHDVLTGAVSTFIDVNL